MKNKGRILFIVFNVTACIVLIVLIVNRFARQQDTIRELYLQIDTLTSEMRTIKTDSYLEGLHNASVSYQEEIDLYIDSDGDMQCIYETGFENGYSDGHSAGYDEGYEAGYAAAYLEYSGDTW